VAGHGDAAGVAGDEAVAVGVVGVAAGAGGVGDGGQVPVGVPGEGLAGLAGDGAGDRVAGRVIGERVGAGPGAARGDADQLVRLGLPAGPVGVRAGDVTGAGVLYLGGPAAEAVAVAHPEGVRAADVGRGRALAPGRTLVRGPVLVQFAEQVVRQAFGAHGGPVLVLGDRAQLAAVVVDVEVPPALVELRRVGL